MFGEDLLSSAVEKKIAKLHLLLEEDAPAWRRADD
jgi:hypothetical protein